MDYALIWSESSKCDLRAIVRYIARRNPSAARRTGTAITDSVRILRRFPLIGAQYERDPSGQTRELLFKTYRIFYRVDEVTKRVVILAVWQASRQEPDLPF
jgi:plasmid stabilization system protein ParE